MCVSLRECKWCICFSSTNCQFPLNIATLRNKTHSFVTKQALAIFVYLPNQSQKKRETWSVGGTIAWMDIVGILAWQVLCCNTSFSLIMMESWVYSDENVVCYGSKQSTNILVSTYHQNVHTYFYRSFKWKGVVCMKYSYCGALSCLIPRIG